MSISSSEELMTSILKSVTIDDLLTICQLSEGKHQLCRVESFWRDLVKKKYKLDKPLFDNFYDTFNYLRRVVYFSPKQLEIIRLIKEESPSWLEEIYQLTNFDYLKYQDTNLPYDHIIFALLISSERPDLDHYGIYIKQGNIYHIPAILGGVFKSIVSIERLPDDIPFDKLRKEGYYIVKDMPWHIYYLYLGKNQIKYGFPTLPEYTKISPQQMEILEWLKKENLNMFNRIKSLKEVRTYFDLDGDEMLLDELYLSIPTSVPNETEVNIIRGLSIIKYEILNGKIQDIGTRSRDYMEPFLDTLITYGFYIEYSHLGAKPIYWLYLTKGQIDYGLDYKITYIPKVDPRNELKKLYQRIASFREKAIGKLRKLDEKFPDKGLIQLSSDEKSIQLEIINEIVKHLIEEAYYPLQIVQIIEEYKKILEII